MSNDIPEFGTPRENEERRDGGCAVVYDPATGLYAVGKRELDGGLILFSGGMQEGEDVETAVLREVREESGLYDFAHVEKVAEAMAHYHNRLKRVNRVAHATCFLIVLKSADTVAAEREEHEKFSLVWESAEGIRANWHADNTGHGLDHWLHFLERGVARLGELGYA